MVWDPTRVSTFAENVGFTRQLEKFVYDHGGHEEHEGEVVSQSGDASCALSYLPVDGAVANLMFVAIRRFKTFGEHEAKIILRQVIGLNMRGLR